MPDSPAPPPQDRVAPPKADPAAEALLERLRVATRGEYDVAGELGRGGMATVYLAHEISLDRKVAIKLMAPGMLHGDGMVERFKREARTAAGLSHPHIIPIYAVREVDGLLFCVIKLVQGTPLDAIMREIGQLPITMVQAILAQVGDALGYADRHGVVHRDIKPGNILIDDEGWAVVTDFGIAKVMDSATLTMTGVAVGTPAYMSPEQCSGEAVTGASDQYSLGVVAYEMLAGRPPFVGSTMMALMFSHFQEEPPPLESLRPDCPPAIRDAVHRMLRKNPAERFPTMDAAIAAMGARTMDRDDPNRSQLITLARTGVTHRIVSQVQTPRSPIPLAHHRDGATPLPVNASAQRTGQTTGPGTAHRSGHGPVTKSGADTTPDSEQEFARASTPAIGTLPAARTYPPPRNRTALMAIGAVALLGVGYLLARLSAAGSVAATAPGAATSPIDSAVAAAPATSRPPDPNPASASLGSERAGAAQTASASDGHVAQPGTSNAAEKTVSRAPATAVLPPASSSPRTAPPESPRAASTRDVAATGASSGVNGGATNGTARTPSTGASARDSVAANGGSSAAPNPVLSSATVRTPVTATVTPSPATPPNAVPPSPPDDAADVRALLRSFSGALGASDLAAALRLYPSMPAEQRGGFEALWKDGGTMSPRWSVSDVVVDGNVATARITGSNLVTTRRGQRSEVPVALRARLERRGGEWRLVSLVN